MATNKNLTRLAILILALAGVWEMPCAVSPPARAGDWLPMLPDQRSLNLSNSVTVAVFEAWRQNGYAGGS